MFAPLFLRLTNKEEKVLIFDIVERTINGKHCGIVATVKGFKAIEAIREYDRVANLRPVGLRFLVISEKVPANRLYWLEKQK